MLRIWISMELWFQQFCFGRCEDPPQERLPDSAGFSPVKTTLWPKSAPPLTQGKQTRSLSLFPANFLREKQEQFCPILERDHLVPMKKLLGRKRSNLLQKGEKQKHLNELETERLYYKKKANSQTDWS